MSVLGPALGTIVLPFALVVYLGLQGGGYDPVVRNEVGIAVWWVILLGAVAGLLPVRRLPPLAWAGLGLLAAFAAWTALGISWSESSERSVEEVARVSTHVGVLALAIAVQGREGLRRTVGGVAAAIALIAGLALLSRLHPSWFPADDPAHFLPSSQGRLNYPLGYWNGLAALIAIGIPLVVTVAAQSRRLAVQGLATAALPVLALAAFYTFSRGGALEIAVGVVALVLLHPRRLALAPTVALGIGGSALAIAAATQRGALEEGVANAVARQQSDEMLAFVLAVCGGVALVRVAIGLAARHAVGPRVRISRRAAAGGFSSLVVGVAIVALAAGAPAELAERWEEFKDPAGAGTGTARFDSASGAGRYQQWQAALDAGESEPLIGIGPGTYEFWWAREAPINAFVRDAHSLYLETFAELGVVGLSLIAALVLAVLGAGTVRAMRSREVEQRAWLAGAVAACAAFAVAAAVDWVWELAVIPVVFLLLAAAILAAPKSGIRIGPRTEPSDPGATPASRLALAILALPALAVIAISLSGTSSVRESQARARSADLSAALGAANAAHDIQPYAASPSLQRALVLELDGDLDGAAAAAREATRKEATNWRTWLTLSRIEAERGRAQEAIGAYRQARSLNPRFPLFVNEGGE